MAKCFAHSYWNLLSDVIHAEIVLLIRKEVQDLMVPYCGYKIVFILEWIENNVVVRSKQD
jgi:hypothetical protein